MTAKYCAKCGRGVSQNYCPQCGGTKFTARQPVRETACEKCGTATSRTWKCAGCGRTVCGGCIRSYKYVSTLCQDCFRIQTATADVPIPAPEEARPEPEEQRQEPQIEFYDEDERPSLFQRIRSLFGGKPRD